MGGAPTNERRVAGGAAFGITDGGFALDEEPGFDPPGALQAPPRIDQGSEKFLCRTLV